MHNSIIKSQLSGQILREKPHFVLEAQIVFLVALYFEIENEFISKEVISRN